jgi:catechol 2,3-dioxygenase-like lactoylglutathione lyase family enzyme
MGRIEEFTAGINLPPVTQIGVVVRDIEQAVTYYSSALGLGPFSPVSDLAIDKHWYRGVKSPIRLRISRVMWGTMEYELIQPVEGRSAQQAFLDTHGEGLHHLGVEVSDYDGVVTRMSQAGVETLVAMEIFNPLHQCWSKASYFDTRQVGGVIIEVMCRPWMAKK